MPNYDLAELVFILDRSGSMAALIKDMREAIDGLVTKQLAIFGRATFTLWTFDTDHSMLFNAVPLTEVPKLAEDSRITARGGTALCDAICMCFEKVGARLAETKEGKRPGKVIVTIMTDGAENSSQTYDHHAVNKLITEQRDKYGWEILFVGANQDAIAEAGKYGIMRNHAMDWSPQAAGVKNMVANVSAYAGRSRGGAGGMSVNNAFTDEERATSMAVDEEK